MHLVMKFLIKVLLFVIFSLNSAESAKILAIFPTPSISHQIVYRVLTQDLAKRGHELLILTPDPVNDGNSNLTEIDLSASYKTFNELFSYGALKDVLHDEFGFIRKAMIIFESLLNEQLSHPDVKKLIDEPERYDFDLMIIEHTGYFPMLAFAEIYDIPMVGITSFEASGFNYQAFGNEANPFIHPEQNYPFAHGELTFSQRFTSLISILKAAASLIVPPSPLTRINNVYKKHFPHVEKSLFELTERVEMFMVNTHPALGFIRPLVPVTIQLGFMHIENAKSLQEGELKSFISRSKNGVVYISFGSNIASKDLDVNFIEVIKSVIKRSEYDFVWKFEDDNFGEKPENLFISKWVPQADLLAHSKIKLFVTQAGQQSVEEAIEREVPMITIPFLGDQPGLAKKLEQKGVSYLI